MEQSHQPAQGGTTPATPNAKPAVAQYLTCFSGPDQGKRVALTEGYLAVGSSTDCEILSDDPEVAKRHAIVALEGGTASVQPVDGSAVFLDGHRHTDTVTLHAGQQLRMGRSLWRVDGAGTAHAGSLLRGLGDRISAATVGEKIQGFSVSEMFSEVFKKRTDEEIEDYFIVGTQHTTPDLMSVETDWPKPWAFARIFLFSVAAYALLVYGYETFQNDNFLPGIIVFGSVAFPLAILVFFFEMNVPRNVSLLQVLRMAVFGGILSLVVALFLFQYTNLDSWMGAMSAGIVEESGKALVVVYFARNRRFRWTLNGLLIGVAVGMGFSVFETMGYVFRSLGGGTQAMFDTITQRGWLNLLGDHTLWTGLVGAALWRVRGDREFRFDMLTDGRFLRVLLLAMALHMTNNAPFDPPFFGKYFLIGFVAWVVLLSFVQVGLREVRVAQGRTGTMEGVG